MFLKLFGFLGVEVGGRDWEGVADECRSSDTVRVASDKGEAIASVWKSSRNN